MLSNLLEKKDGNYVLVNKAIKPPEKDFKAEIKENIVNKISVYLSGENNFFLAPFYLFLKESFSIWLSKIDSFVDSGNVKCYAEDA